MFVGPGLVALFFDLVGTQGLVWILSGLYFIAAILTRILKLPEEEMKKEDIKEEVHSVI